LEAAEVIEPIGPLAALGDIVPSARPIGPSNGFAAELMQGAERINSDLNIADQATRALAAGTDMPVHDVMIALEQARIDLQFVVQVRNRVLAAYHDIVNMQV
jgi:flagellar hook-basal body complex protein FliE